jgi:hypothetical protein
MLECDFQDLESVRDVARRVNKMLRATLSDSLFTLLINMAGASTIRLHTTPANVLASVHRRQTTAMGRSHLQLLQESSATKTSERLNLT